MSKLFLIGDIHLGLNQIYIDKWLSIHNKYFYEFFIPLLKDNYTKDDYIIILGNLFNNKTSTNHKILSFALDIFNIFEKLEYKIIILNGENETTNCSPLRILEKYKNIKIIKDSTLIKINNKNILLLPWDKPSNQLKNIKKQSIDYLFSTINLKGSKISQTKTMIAGINIGDLIEIKNIYSASNNIRQNIDNFKYIGNPLHMNENDIENDKGIYIIDLYNDSETFIKNDITPIFKNIEILIESDLDKLEINKNNFINVIIKNELYTNINYRRKIEEYSHSKIINDINIINDNIIETTIENDEDIDINISTEELMREYIKKQNCDDSNKIEYLKIFDDALKIINKNENSKN